MNNQKTIQGNNYMQMSGISQQNTPQIHTQQFNNMNNNQINTQMVNKFLKNNNNNNQIFQNNNQFNMTNNNSTNQNNMNNLNNNNMMMNPFFSNNDINNNNSNNNNQNQFQMNPFNGNNIQNMSNNFNDMNNMNNMNISNNQNNLAMNNNNNNFNNNNNNNNNEINIGNINNNDQNIMNEICENHTMKLSKYYDYKPSEATSHLNSLLKDMDIFGEITKKKIEQERVSNPSKFISVDEAMSFNNQNNMNMNMGMNNMNMGMNSMNMGMNNSPKNDYFVLSILKLALESEGCTCEIERGDPQLDEEKEFYTAIQFIVNGMYKFKKYILEFDFGEEKNNIMLNDLLAQTNFNNLLVKNLKDLLNLTVKDIVISNPRKGSYKVTAIIKKSNFNELTDVQLLNQLKQNPDYVGLIKVEKTILLNGCKLNLKMLDSRGDRYSGWGVNEMRGGRPYNPPLGWTGYGIRVLDRYDGGNNTWLDFNNYPGEWSVAYHGMGTSLSGQINLNQVDNFNNMMNNMMNTVLRQQFKNDNDKYHSGKTVGEGIYMTQYPKIMEQFSSVYTCQGRKYKIGIMCRVMPDKIRCPMNSDDFWVINGTDNEVRPYRILIKEVN